MPDLHPFTLQQALDAMNQGETTSEALVQALLDRIKKVDEQIQAYTHLNAERALEDARAADQARKDGDQRPLLGLPIAVKDVLNVKDDPCLCASNLLKGYTAPYDATAVTRLRDAGAILLGRVNMDEFAMGSSTENSAIQLTRNPRDLERVPGGSSGGSAAAVAADEALAALGTDTGGSIRQPAAFCGCVGLKPSYGRISRLGLTAFASSLDQIGPMTKTVQDAATLLQVMAGHDAGDSTSVEEPVPDYGASLTGDLKGMKLGLPAEYFIEGMDHECEAVVRAAIKQCEDLGAELVEVNLPHTEYAVATYYIIATAEASANLARFDGVRYGNRVAGEDPIDQYGKTRAAGFGPEVKRRIILGTYVLSSGYYDAYYIRAQKVRTLIRKDFEEAFKQCDALLTPTTPFPAFKIGQNDEDPLQMYLNDIFTVTANLAGICGISVPCGETSAGLPVGLQVLGPAFGEETILRVGDAYERAAGWERKGFEGG